jgi:hypothetical protein
MRRSTGGRRMNRGRMMTKKRWTRSTMENCQVLRSTLTVPEEELIHLLRGHIGGAFTSTTCLVMK